MKIIDERQGEKNIHTYTHKDRKEERCDGSYIESVIFKSNLEWAFSIILNEREFYESKLVVVECRCLKIWDLLSFLICFSIIVLKWQQASLV